jgi:hypothetical protein
LYRQTSLQGEAEACDEGSSAQDGYLLVIKNKKVFAAVALVRLECVKQAKSRVVRFGKIKYMNNGDLFRAAQWMEWPHTRR